MYSRTCKCICARAYEKDEFRLSQLVARASKNMFKTDETKKGFKGNRQG